jgi:hypothetical protein
MIDLLNNSTQVGLNILKTCVISLATNDKHFPEGLKRLERSVRRSGYNDDLIFWQPGQHPQGCPSHQDVPFAFKTYCFREAYDRGMELVLWMDSSCVVLRTLVPIFRAMTDDGYILFGNKPHRVGQWISDEALSELAMSRAEAMRISEISAGVVGLNLRNSTARQFLKLWSEAAEGQVIFRGSRQSLSTQNNYEDMKWNRNGRASTDPRVKGHRHDQTAAGVFAHQLGMKLTYTGVQPYSASYRRIFPGTVIAVDRTVGRKDAELWSVERIRRDRYIGAFAQLASTVRNRWR